MLTGWRRELYEILVNAANPAGAWGYRAGAEAAAEPTALAAMALSAAENPDDEQAARRRETAIHWLAETQRDDGAVPVTGAAGEPSWPTALAILAWLSCGRELAGRHRTNVDRAAARLLETRGKGIQSGDPSRHHDTTLVGWPWVAGSHSWLEPTAYAVMALRASGASDHPRVREATQLIRDRALASGGWNYGNRMALGRELRPFPATTGVALIALAGGPKDGVVAAGLDYLTSELPRIRAPLSLAWGIRGLRAWDTQPDETECWLATAARRVVDSPANPHYIAALLLAGAARDPFLASAEVGADA